VTAGDRDGRTVAILGSELRLGPAVSEASDRHVPQPRASDVTGGVQMSNSGLLVSNSDAVAAVHHTEVRVRRIFDHYQFC
jgi:hypothetical protein